MEKSVVVLYRDFGKEWVRPLVDSKAKRVGLHAHPFEDTVDEFLRAADDLRDVTDALEEKGVAVEYYLHATGYLLSRDLFADSPDMFRQNEKGERTADYNCCPSSERALDIIAARTAKLAERLKQRSHRYHLWQDDDLGGDISCRCENCKKHTPTAQNLILAKAMLRGLRAYDPQAELSLLVYGEDEADIPAEDGIFVEFAPFRRNHALPLTDGEQNRAFCRRLEKLVQAFPKGRVEVLEYFLSYDYAGFCRDGERVKKDTDYYRSLGIARLSTFAVFPQKDYVKTHGFDGISKFFDI